MEKKADGVLSEEDVWEANVKWEIVIEQVASIDQKTVNALEWNELGKRSASVTVESTS